MTRVNARTGLRWSNSWWSWGSSRPLAALALMIAPAIANQDNTLKGTADVQASLKIAQGLAAASRQPRGVRFIAQSGTTTTTPPPPLYMVTELQYLESPPVLVPNPKVLVPGAFPGDTTGTNGPQVQFVYKLNNKNAVTTRHCYIYNMTADQVAQVVANSTLVLPTLNAYMTINSFDTKTYEAVLSAYPDAALGAGTNYVTYYFGIYGPPRPLLGEPTVELPMSIGVDLTLCSPAGVASSTGQYANYDVLFAPSGQRLGTASVAAGVRATGRRAAATRCSCGSATTPSSPPCPRAGRSSTPPSSKAASSRSSASAGRPSARRRRRGATAATRTRRGARTRSPSKS